MADDLFIPEIPYAIAKAAEQIKRRTAGRGRQYSIVVVAEGAKPVGGGVTLKEEAATPWQRHLMFCSVRLFGWIPWQRHTRRLSKLAPASR